MKAIKTTMDAIYDEDVDDISDSTEETIHDEDIECIYETINAELDDSLFNYYSHKYIKNMIGCLEQTFGDMYSNQYPDFIQTALMCRDIPEYVVASGTNTNTLDEINEGIVQYLQSKPQPDQKSDEWYTKRKNMITASNLWKVFKSQASRNSLIFEKCNVNSVPFKCYSGPMEWGNKYEPVSVMVYEDKYKTKVGDFGCITHENYEYIGASPDGINIDKNSPLYGRMLEIKNIVNRDITGIPKEEYWIQMQVQMETCKLEYCDFLETRFKEYETEEMFYENTTDASYKGVILHFINKPSVEHDNDEFKPFYVYYDITLDMDKESIDQWIESSQKLHADTRVLIKQSYYYLHELSCVLVKRNTPWFNSGIHLITDIWDTVIKERVSGYEHRRPKSRKKKVEVAADADAVTKIGHVAPSELVQTIPLITDNNDSTVKVCIL
jgi:putative phage-type endonuclease